MPRPTSDRAFEIAAFRYRLIADAAEAAPRAVAEQLRRIAESVHTDPRGRQIQCSVRTLERYLAAYRKHGLRGLRPKGRCDRGTTRAIRPEILQRAVELRRQVPSRATRTLIDLMVREGRVARNEVARSTLDRHLERLGESRVLTYQAMAKVFQKIETNEVFELVVTDFHHGPYVRASATHLEARRTLLCAFIDHYSRNVIEGRYYLHEDFVALRFGFRHLVLTEGTPGKLYCDNGSSYQATRFMAACADLNITLVHSKPYVAESRGVIERFNRTLKEQFEAEVHARPEPLTLDELNAFFEAWLAERYHLDVHSETGETPAARFARRQPRPVPDPTTLDEALRLRERRSVHRKWSTVEVGGERYLVDSALRGRRVDVLIDPLAPEYVLVVFDGRPVQRAYKHKAGAVAPPVPPPPAAGPPTDYLALLRRDYEKRRQAELSALRLRPAQPSTEIALVEFVALLESCRGSVLSPDERTRTSALWRKLRPLEPALAEAAAAEAKRHLGIALHIDCYLDHLQAHVVRLRTKGARKP